jgi:hypothetical protein
MIEISYQTKFLVKTKQEGEEIKNILEQELCNILAQNGNYED